MNIIHYLIGLPPTRHGGAPVYARDLLLEQASVQGISVSILVQGDTLCLGNRSRISKSGEYRGIPCYEITNPILSPLVYGLRKAEYILDRERCLDKSNLDCLYEEVKPDVMHVHTLMGLPLDLLKYMKTKGVKLVLTSHDYYGICPRVNLITRLGTPCAQANGSMCEDCNRYSKSKGWLKLLNSKLFLRYKHLLRVNASKSQAGLNGHNLANSLQVDNESRFVELSNYYKRYLEMFDAIHFNSNVSKEVFSSHINLPYNEVIPITTRVISDHRREKNYGDILRMSFVAGIGMAKGFPLLKQVLMELYNEGFTNWELNIWEGHKIEWDPDCELIHFRGRYTSEQLPDVYGETDLLVVPSIWKETFSLVALEALSYGVPVLMSENVGAQVLVESVTPELIYHGPSELKEKLRGLMTDINSLSLFNQKILKQNSINFNERKHAEDMLNFYKRVMKQ